MVLPKRPDQNLELSQLKIPKQIVKKTSNITFESKKQVKELKEALHKLTKDIDTFPLSCTHKERKKINFNQGFARAL